jgi:TP901 family phage tail tape measure protein
MGQLDSLHVDLSLRNHQQVITGVGQVQSAVTRLKSTVAGGLAVNFAKSNLSEIKSLLGAGGLTAMLGVGTVKLAADLEKARLGLKRFVDTDFDNLSTGIDKMSLRIPIAVEGLYDIASGAAQVGVEGTANILAFTEVVGKLATVSSMSFNETAKDLAKLHNVFGMKPSQVNTTANVIAGMSAASAADPGELITTTRYLSGAASTIGMTLNQTIALAASLKDAGVSSEVAGTAMTKLILDMGEIPEKFALITGKTKEEFKKLRDANPIKALLEALKSIDSEGSIDDKIAKAKEIGVESARQSGAILQLIRALETFQAHIGRADKFADEKTALDKQFNTQSESTYAKLTKLANAFMQVADQLGGGVSRSIGKFADTLTEVADSLTKKPELKPGETPAAPKLNYLTGQPVLTDDEREALRVKALADAFSKSTPAQQAKMFPTLPDAAKEIIQGRALPLTDKQKKEKEEADQAAKLDLESAAAREAAKKKLDAAQQEYDDAVIAIAKRAEEIDKLYANWVAIGKNIETAFKQLEVLKANGDKTGRDLKMDQIEKAQKASRDYYGVLTNAERAQEIDKQRLPSLQKFLDDAKAALSSIPLPSKDAAKAKEKAEKESFAVQQGARKFALEEMMDPKGFKAFRDAFAALPKALLETDAGKSLAKKLDATKGAEVGKQMTEDELSQLAQKRAGAMQSLTDAAARERMQKLWARPQFESADSSWKRIQAGAMEGSPMERMIKEQTRLQKITTEMQDELNKMFKEFKVEWKNNAIVFSGDA